MEYSNSDADLDMSDDVPVGMSDDDLKSALDSARNRMMVEEESFLSEKRKFHLDRYLGEPDGREREGYSSYVTREVFEAVEWVMPALLRVFTSGDRVVEFEPFGPEDEQQAKQETDVVNHYLLKENPGFLNFYEWIWDILMNPNGYVKAWAEEGERVRTEQYKGLTDIQLQQIASHPDIEIIEHTGYPHVVQYPQGPMEEMCHDITVRVVEKSVRIKWAATPPEQVGVDPECTSVDVDEARWVRHACLRTKSELIEMGYDPEILDSVPTWSEMEDWNSESINRHESTSELFGTNESMDDSTGLYELEEWYVKIDFDGDGIAESRKIDVIGGEIVGNEEDDFQPVVSCSAIPMPHRHAGIAWVEPVTAIQELSTYYQRSLNDNIARVNRPRKYISENAITDDGMTIDQLLDIDSEVVIARDASAIVPEQHQPVIQEILMVHQAVKDQLQMRTGVAPGIAMDSDVLQKTTAGAYGDAMDAASQLIEKLTRVIAEVGVSKLVKKVHRLIKEHQDKPKTLKIRGQWIETNPRDWRDRENVTINVGLGFDDKGAQKAAAAEMIGMQMQLMQAGFVSPQNIMASLEDFVEAQGRKGVDRYFTLPQPQPQQQQPDPLTMAQVQAITEQTNIMKMKEGSKIQRENAMMDAKLEGENAKTQKALADAAKAATEAGSAQIKQQAEMLAPQFASD